MIVPINITLPHRPRSSGTSISEERSNPTVLSRYNDYISGHARGDAGRLPRVTGAAGAGDCGLR